MLGTREYHYFYSRLVASLLQLVDKLLYYGKLENIYKSFRKPIKEEVILDIGSNRGQSVKFFRNLMPDTTIHAFEPLEKPFLTLKNSNLNSYNMAVSNTSGTKTFYQNVMDETSTFEWPGRNTTQEFIKRLVLLSSKRNFYVSIQVQCTTVDETCEFHKIDSIYLLKIDTEGHELNVLLGAKNVLSKRKVFLVQVERKLDYQNQSSIKQVATLLESFGYLRVFSVKHPLTNTFDDIYLIQE